MSKNNWISVNDRLPEVLHDTKFLVSISGLSLNASEYTSIETITYRPNIGFIRWQYNSEGNFVSEIFNPKSNQDIYCEITHWNDKSLPDPPEVDNA